MASAAAAASGAASSFAGRLWFRYLAALNTRPIRTKMIQSGVLYVVADATAQFGIEGRRLDVDGIESDETKRYDPWRTARMTFYGTFVFAPLAHFWHMRLEKIKFASSLGTIAARVSTDCLLWSPFVCLMFPTCLGLLEGKNPRQVQDKVKLSWFPTWTTAICVFGPTQVVNFALIPMQHRLLALQSVGMCWNIFLSWSNTRNNRRLAEAAALVEKAEAAEALAPAAAGPSAAVEAARVKLYDAGVKRDKLRAQADPVKVGTRMGWA